MSRRYHQGRYVPEPHEVVRLCRFGSLSAHHGSPEALHMLGCSVRVAEDVGVNHALGTVYAEFEVLEGPHAGVRAFSLDLHLEPLEPHREGRDHLDRVPSSGERVELRDVDGQILLRGTVSRVVYTQEVLSDGKRVLSRDEELELAIQARGDGEDEP